MRQLTITKSITNRNTESLDKYLHDISKEGLLSVEDEVNLARRIKKGDREALERLTKANLRFVVSVAKQYQNHGISLPDLINEGNIGLIKAAVKFDETKGFKFISYAVWWIRQAIIQAITEHSRLVRLPPNQIDMINKINKAFSKFEHSIGREPTIAELADEVNLSKEKVKDLMKISRRNLSVDAPFASDDDSNLLDVIANDDAPIADKILLRESLNKELDMALANLSARERDIIELFFGINKSPITLDEISERVGLTTERVRQIKDRALIRLRHNTRNNELITYLT